MPTTVTTFAQLQAALLAADSAAANTGPIEIDISGTIAETADPTAINLASGNTLLIRGVNGGTLNGQDPNDATGATYHRGLFVYQGTVAIQDLTIENAHAVGGAGGSNIGGAGGGAGLGGGLFVAGTGLTGLGTGGQVTLQNVTFAGDAATGGAGGSNTGNSGNPAGGGGLGGAGGNNNGGGGGIGGGANGGSTGAAAGAGIVAGAANGGGGGAAGVSGSTPSGGGVAPSGDDGGFGGGGGGGANGRGGFGGGGEGGAGGNGTGGFGGGGGGNYGNGAAGGFGAGNGSAFAGGGGLGAGGDIFVMQGGSLTVVGGALGAGTAAGGAGGTSTITYQDNTYAGQAGQGYGGVLFIEGNQSARLAAAQGQTLQVAGVIADQGGSGGTGAGSLVIGAAGDTGTVTLGGANTYSGGTSIQDGTLDLARATAAGTGAITFVAPSGGNTVALALDGAAQPASGGTFANTLANFNAAGETLDLKNFTASQAAYSSSSTRTTLVVDGRQFNLSNGSKSYKATSDGNGGTLLTPLPLSKPTVQAETGTETPGATLAGTGGITGSGALDGDADNDGGTVSITAVGFGAMTSPITANSTATNGPTVIAGTYGTLSIGADGSYTYTDTANGQGLAVVTAGGPITDTFVVTVTTSEGTSSNSTLAITTSLASGAETVSNPTGTATYTIGATTLTLNETTGSTFGGVIQDGTADAGGKVVVTGGQTLTLTAASTYTGGTTVNAGSTLQLGNGSANGTVAGGIVDNGTVAFDENTAITYAGTVSGTSNPVTGEITVAGPGAVTLSGSLSGILGVQVANNASATIAGTLTTTSGLGTGGSNNASVYAVGAGSSVTVSGTITSGSDGVQIDGGTLTETATGTVSSTAGSGYHGVYARNGGTIVNQGSIQASGQAAVYFDAPSVADATFKITGGGTVDGGVYGIEAIGDGGAIVLGTTNAGEALGAVGGGTGIFASDTGAGTIGIVTGGDVSVAQSLGGPAASGSGIVASTTGTGAVSVTAGGNVSAAGAGNSGIFVTGTQAGDSVAVAAGKIVQGAIGLRVSGGTTVLTNSGTIATTAGAGGNAVQIDAGALAVGDNALGTLTGDVQDVGTLVFTEAGTVALANTVKGTGGVSQTGGGITTLSGTNTYSGATTVSAGTLKAGSAQAFGTNSAATVSATLDLNGYGETVGSLAGASIGIVTDGAADTAVTLTTGGLNASPTYAGKIQDGAGKVGLTKVGTGTLTLSGQNSYSGATTVSGGALKAGSARAFGTNSAVTVSATLDLAGFGETIGSLAGTSTGVVTNSGAGPAALTTGGLNASSTFAGTVQDGAAAGATTALVKTGTGTQTLTGQNTYTGGTTIAGGTLQIGDGTTTGALVGAVADGATLAFDEAAGTPLVFAGVISDDGAMAGAVRQIGGTTILTGQSGYTGGTTIAGGVLQLGNGTATGAIAGPIADGGVLAFDEGATALTFAGAISDDGSMAGTVQQIAGTTTLSGSSSYTGVTALAGGTLALGSAAAIGSAGTVSFTGGTLRYTAANTTDYSGRFSNAAGQAYRIDTGGQTVSYAGSLSSSGGTLAKLGVGTLDLTGTDTYTGATTVAGGTLLVDGTDASSAFEVQNGATLGGHGRVGAVTVDAGGFFAPGDSPGQITATSLTLAQGSYFQEQLGGATPGTGYDQTVVQNGGTVALNGANLQLSNYGGYVPYGNESFDIIVNQTGKAVQGIFAGLQEGATTTLNDETFKITYTGSATGGAGTGNDVVLTEVDQAPTASITTNPYAATEQTTLSLQDGGLSIADADGGNNNGAETATLTVGEGTLNATAGTNGATVSGSGTNQVTITGTVAQIDAFLNGTAGGALTYIDNTDTPSATTALTLVANDGAKASNTARTTIAITAVNDPPSSTVPANGTYSTPEQTALSLQNAGLSVSDVDGGTGRETATLSVGEGTLTAAAGTGASAGVTVSGSGTGTLTLTGTLAQLDALLQGTDGTSTLGYVDNTDTPNNTVLTLNVTDNGNTGTGGPQSAPTRTTTITNVAVNDAPTAGAPAAGVYQATEQTPLSLQNAGLTVGDVDGGTGSETATLTVGEGTLNATAGNSGAGVAVSGDGKTVTVTGTVAQIDAFLNGTAGGALTYVDSTDTPSATTALTLSIDDNGNTGAGTPNPLTATASTTIAITAVNDPPSSTVPANGTYSTPEQTALSLQNAGLSVSDVDGGTGRETATLSVGEGTLTAAAGTGASAGVTVSGSGTGTLTLTGTLAQLDALLQGGDGTSALGYVDNTDTPNNTVLTLNVTDNGNTGTGGPQSAPTRTTTIANMAVNDAPVAVVPSIAYQATEQTPLNLKNTGLSVSDVDGGTGSETATLTVGEGTLNVTAGNSGAGVSVSGDGKTVTIIGTTTQIDAVLNGQGSSTLGYIDPLDMPSASDTLTLSIDDNGNTGAGTPNPLTATAFQTIYVAPVNDPPTAAAPANLSAVEQTALNLAGKGLSVGDVDGGSGVETVTLSVGEGTITAAAGTGASRGLAVMNSGTATVSIKGTVAQLDALLQGTDGTGTLTYIDPSDTPSANTTLTLSIDDNGNTGSGGAMSAQARSNIAIQAVNDAPTATAATATYQAVEQTTLNLKNTGLLVGDVDGGSGIEVATLSVGEGAISADAGNSGAQVSGSGTGAVTITGTLDQINGVLDGQGTSTLSYFDNSDTPSNSQLTLSIDDEGNTGSGGPKTGVATATIDVARVNDAPVAMSSTAVYQAVEQTPLNLKNTGLSVSDVDGGAGIETATLSVDEGTLTAAAGDSDASVAGSGSGTVTITGTTAQIDAVLNGTGTSALSYSDNTDTPSPSTDLTLTIDDNGNTGSGGPLSSTARSTIAIQVVNDAPVATSSMAIYQAVEQTALNLKNTGLSVSDVDGGAGIETATLSVGEGTLTAAAGDSGAGVAGSGSGTVTITGTTAQIDAVLNGTGTSALSYSDDTDTPSPSTGLTLTVNDNGNTGSGGPLSSTARSTIAVQAVNDAPIATAATATYQAREKTSLNLKNTGLSVSDVDGGAGIETATLSVGEGTLTAAAGDSGASVAGSGSGTATITGTTAQIDAVLNGPGTSALSYFDVANNPSPSTGLTLTVNDNGNTGSGGPLSSTARATIAVAPDPDTVSIAQPVSYADGVFTLTGTASSAAGVTSVEISAVLNYGARQDLGAATLNGDGSWVFQDAIGSNLQGFLVATETDGAGQQATSTDPLFSLTGGLGPNGSIGRQRLYDGEGDVTSATLFGPNGLRSPNAEAPGQTFASTYADTFYNHRAADTAFVFDPGYSLDVVNGFRLRGPGHDTLSFMGSDFGGTPEARLGALLANSFDGTGGLFIVDPTTQDAVQLKGFTKAQLVQNERDIVFR